MIRTTDANDVRIWSHSFAVACCSCGLPPPPQSEERMADRPPDSSELPDLSPDRLRLLYQVSRSLPSVDDWTELVERMMDLVLETVKAERGVLFLRGRDGAPRPEVVRGAD